MSWINPRSGGVITRFIYDMTEPLLAFCRRILPSGMSMPVDFSPIIAMIVIQLVYQILVRIIVAVFY